MDESKGKKLAVIFGSNSTIASWIKIELDILDIHYLNVSRKPRNKNDLYADATSYENVLNAYKEIRKNFKKIDSIYYCCGSVVTNTIENSNPKSWINDINVNLIGAYNVFRAFNDVDFMNNKIRFIFIGSTASISKPKNVSAYSIAKLALEQLVTYINNETRNTLRACCIRLGTSKTEFYGAQDLEMAANNKDIANAIQFIENARVETLPDLISIRPIL